MCGIASIISKAGKSICAEDLEKMNQMVIHRGPDDGGVFLDGSLGLGHRRLSIIDLSKDGHQPMIEDKLVLVYNGEIYNYKEIREELIGLGYNFFTETDTEVIIKSYKEWGETCVTRFNGMWSFALYDQKHKKVFCSRDRFGVKPFYYYNSTDWFAFGSEIKQLLNFPAARVASLEKISNFLVYGESEDNENTFFQFIKKLPAGHSLVYDLNLHLFEIKKYYDITFRPEYAKLNLHQSIEQFRVLFKSAVALRLRSDVVVGACLSGGLDSSTIVAVASSLRDQNNPLTVINAKSVDNTIDESHFAALVADYTQSKLVVTKPGMDEFTESVLEVIRTQEEPFVTPSPIFQYHVFKAAKENGCTVMLDGQGGDENLLGYEYYGGLILQQSNIWEILKKIKNMASKSNVSKLGLVSQLLFLKFYKLPTFRFYIKKKHPYFKSPIFKYKNDNYRNARYKVFNSGNIFEIQRQEFFYGSIPPLLRFEDKNSMAHSIESRLPFLDYRVVEFCCSIPLEHKIWEGWSKLLIRESMKEDLPEDILWRRDKLGFNAPTASWLKDKSFIYKEICDTIWLNNLVDTNKLEQMDDNMIWRLYNLAVWSNTFKVVIPT
jgi:asparagine synthase (glutamine-hydrolysing)